MFRLVKSKYKSSHHQAKDLLSAIDDKILCLATGRYDSYRTGVKSVVPYSKYQLLLLLRRVLDAKLCGDNCDCTDINRIVIAVSKLLYNIC